MKNNTVKVVISLSVVLVLVLVVWFIAGRPSIEEPVAEEPVVEEPAKEVPTKEVPVAVEPEKSFDLKLAGIKTPDDPASLAMEKFAEIVNNHPTANITIRTFNNSVLGPMTDMKAGMPTGVTDMFYNTLSGYGWLEGAKKFNAVAAPFIWDSQEQMQAFLDSDVAKQWFEESAASTGVRVVAASGELPPRQLTSNRPIRNADDFKGLMIRTAPAALVQQTMSRLDATPVVVPFADLYMALRQGVAEAQENNFITVKKNSLYEVQKYFMTTNYIRDVGAMFIAERIWKQMSPAQQAVMQDASLQVVKYEAELIAALMDETMEYLRNNMTYIETDVKSIQDKLGADIYQEFDQAGELWPTGTIDVILEFKAGYKN